jgi:sarcosine oxidase
MLHAYPLWRQLDDEVGGGILHECGLMYFGHGDSAAVQSVEAGLAGLNVPHELLGSSAVRRVFPALHLDADEVGVFTPEAGWVNAELAVRRSVELAQSHGAQVVQRRIENLDELEARFDAYVVCAGAWTSKLLPAPVRVTLQTFGYVGGAGGPIEGPVWIEEGPLGMYGFPSEPGANTVKIGVHEHGPEIDPDDADRTPSMQAAEIIRSFAERRFAMATTEISEVTGCLYTSTDDEDFLLGRAGEKGFFASACSGHGFKFGPWIGRLLADFVEEKDAPEAYPRFFLKPD